MLIYKDKDFLPTLLALAVPVCIQNLLSASLNFIDVFMIEKLGETSVAAVGSANQFIFFYLMLIFSVSGGAGIFAAQYWGSKNFTGIRKVMSIGLLISIAISVLFTGLIFLFPVSILRLYSLDAAVHAIGKEYIAIVAFSCIATAISANYAVMLRSTGQVKLPMYASLIGVSLNTFGNYCLIFGAFGFPEMGVKGAAIATVIARTIEFVIIVVYSYVRKHPAAINLNELLSIDTDLLGMYISRSTPVILQGAGWSFGYNMYTMIYGHVSTVSLAAFNLASSVERICLIVFVGLGVACSIMVGNRIGSGENEKAKGYAANFLQLTIICGLLMGLLLLLSRGTLLSLYSLSDDGMQYFSGILFVMALVAFAKGLNIVFHMGVFKGGGDTLFGMIVDIGGIWLIGVPLAALGAFVLEWPVHWVVALASIEEISKASAAFIRFFSHKWIHNLVKPMQSKEEETVLAQSKEKETVLA
ncbi:Na+ driven multidrug efflux pump [Chitinispirillum alkaliphilum]|nr:Na+ driven multidrug efflux pump [Chitinispirillum alkaliphilum]